MIRRIWTGTTLVVIMGILMAGAPTILSADPQIYLPFFVCVIWAPIAFILVMIQQATGKSNELGAEGGIL